MSSAELRGCYGVLLAVGRPLADEDVGPLSQAVQQVLACDRLRHCGNRLECTWMASQVARKLASAARG